MIPPRQLILVFCLVFIATAFIVSSHTESALATPPAIQGATKAYCSSEAGGSVVYVSKIFDVAMKAKTKISTLPLNFAFKNYLVEEYDFKTNANYPTNCGLFGTLSQAEANKRQLMADAQRANKQVVEVNWNPGLIVETPQADESVTIGPKGPVPTHTICAIGHQTTTYFSAVFDTSGSHVDPAWDNAFNNFLKKNYGAEGLANCTSMATRREAERLLKDRVYGLRVNNHKAVETGWKFDPNDIAANKPRPKPTPTPDDDPEPAAQQRPTPAPPPPSVKDFAAKEGPQVLAYCQKDPLMSKVFDCYRVQRSVYNYRMEHGDSETLASLFKQEKVNLAEAIGTGLGQWVRDRATAQGLGNRAINCIEQKFNVSFYEKPYISKMVEIYNASVVACK